jgi:branched-chain amino acid transport system permease protein
MSLEIVVAILVSGCVLGSLYALMAIGLALIWSTLRVFNFAHGAILTLGAFFVWTAVDRLELGLAGGVLVGLVAMIALSALFELAIVRPFIRRPQGDLLVMIATLAAANIIVSLIQLGWGAQLKQLPEVASGAVRFLDTSIGANQLAAVICAPLLIGLTAAMLRYTRFGLAIRAVEQNRDMARLVGISPQVVYGITIAIAVGLATIAGALLGGIDFVTPTMGNDPLLKAFVVVVFGGLAGLKGTMIGAYVIGLIEALSTYYIGLFWTPVVIFGVMVAIMIARPQGLVGASGAAR